MCVYIFFVVCCQLSPPSSRPILFFSVSHSALEKKDLGSRID